MKYMLLFALAVIPLSAYAQTTAIPGESYHMFQESNATEAPQVPIETMPTLQITNMTFGFSNQTNINFGMSNQTQFQFQQANSTNILNNINGTIPTWVKGIFAYWEQGKISDNELVNAIQFLVKIGIIKL